MAKGQNTSKYGGINCLADGEIFQNASKYGGINCLAGWWNLPKKRQSTEEVRRNKLFCWMTKSVKICQSAEEWIVLMDGEICQNTSKPYSVIVISLFVTDENLPVHHNLLSKYGGISCFAGWRNVKYVKIRTNESSCWMVKSCQNTSKYGEMNCLAGWWNSVKIRQRDEEWTVLLDGEICQNTSKYGGIDCLAGWQNLLK